MNFNKIILTRILTSTLYKEKDQTLQSLVESFVNRKSIISFFFKIPIKQKTCSFRNWLLNFRIFFFFLWLFDEICYFFRQLFAKICIFFCNYLTKFIIFYKGEGLPKFCGHWKNREIYWLVMQKNCEIFQSIVRKNCKILQSFTEKIVRFVNRSKKKRVQFLSMIASKCHKIQ